MYITVATCNFENNGGGNFLLWKEMHARLKSLGLDLLLRQEVWNAQENEGELADAAEEVLGMTGLIGERSCTALYIRPDVFTSVHQWPTFSAPRELPPTVHSLRLAGTSPDAVPLIAGSFHFSYSSPTTRLIEAEALTTWNDKWKREGDELVKLPALFGGDTNSYPEPGLAGDPALPVLENIADKPHRAHRSSIGPGGRRRMDVDPDDTLRTAGLEDVARHLATTSGTESSLTRTVHACDTHGPDARIDRIYASGQLLPAVESVGVIDMSGLSDHDTVVLRLHRGELVRILNNPARKAA